jgi:hypothetical protein
MNRYLLLLIFSLLISVAYGQDIPGKTFGGTGNDIGYTLCSTNDGGFLLAGTTRSSSAGSEDIYVIKISYNGTEEWHRTFGWLHSDVIRSVIAVDDGYILLGNIWDYGFARQDIYMMKIDFHGYVVWEQFYGSNSHDIGFKVIPDRDNGYLIMGYSRGFEPHGDFFLIKTDHDGNQVWGNNYGSNYDDYGFDLLQENNNDIVMIGSKGGFYDDVHANYKNHDADIYLIKADKNGSEQWKKTYGGNGHDFGQAIVPSDDGGYFLLGSTQSSGAGSFDMALIKTNEDFEEEWQETFGGTDYEYGMSMAKNDQGDLFLFGTTKSFGTDGSADYYLIKTDGTGNPVWDLTIGGPGIELGHQVIATADSGCLVIGQSNSYGEGAYDILITKVDKNGLIEYFIDGIDTTFDNDFLVYPNPTRGYGKVKLAPGIPAVKYRIELVSLNGSFTKAFTIFPPDYDFNTFDIRPGFYIYRIISEDNSKILFTGKLVVH